MRVKPKISLTEFNPKVAGEWHPTKNNDLTPDDVTPGSNKPAWWLGECGHEWYTRCIKDRAYTTKGCPYCSGRKVLSGFNDLATLVPKVVSKWDSERNGDLRPQDVQPGSHKKAYWKDECGHSWFAAIRHVAKKGYGCPVCAGKHGGFEENSLAQAEPGISRHWHPDNDRSPSEITRVSAYRALWICEEGHEFSVRVCDRVNYRTGCPTCSVANISKPEKEMLKFVHELGVETLENSTLKTPGFEADVLCPKEKIAIEYNGLYWHCERRRGKMYHYDKTEAFIQAGYQLIHVWEDDWRDRRGAVERLLARKLGVSSETKLNARSLLPGEATSAEARTFLEEYHVQGFIPGSVRLTLEDSEGVIRALMLFRKRREGVWELTRYATNGIVRGGFSKILKRFQQEYKPEEVITFSDRGVSTGDLYRNSGFTEDGFVTPDYQYIKRGYRSHKFNYRKERFKKDPKLKYEEGLTERELARLNNLDRVYDAGKVRWVLKTC